MKSSVKKGLITFSILTGLSVSAIAAPIETTEAASSGAAVVGYFILLVALIVAPAFKGSKTAH
jgi:hypothetical protein